MAKIKTKVQDDQAYLSFIGKDKYEEICLILGISLDDLKWISHYEIESSLNYKEFLSQEFPNDIRLLVRRRKEGVKIMSFGSKAIYTTDRTFMEIFFKSKGIDLKKLFHEEVEEREEVTGTVANQGKISGEAVLVLSTKDFDKIKSKENKNLILIAHELTPDYTPILESVNGVISDVGGITSHAAIITRELNKPCIIGTEIATKVFKDGDFIKLDAIKGVVKKIKEISNSS